ncbi:NUDIX domain-containing protein [Atopobacter phocae]|uniref:NUDIX domain-containing protein n=1 Tax=Atopobacter phocae TaxID=136492 RepID=UPI00046F48A2|nr:NUDIX hydrolase [Atopobacter phocae]
MELNEKTLRRETVYEGVLLHVVKDDVKLPDGSKSTREMILHPGAAAVIPFTSDNRLLLVKQFRKPLERVLYEIPAGKIDATDNNPLETIKRELEEETGYQASDWSFYRTSALAVGYSSELIHLYIAKNLYKVEDAKEKDVDEFIEVVAVTYDELKQLEADGELLDSKTQMALDYWTNIQLNRK